MLKTKAPEGNPNYHIVSVLTEFPYPILQQLMTHRTMSAITSDGLLFTSVSSASKRAKTKFINGDIFVPRYSERIGGMNSVEVPSLQGEFEGVWREVYSDIEAVAAKLLDKFPKIAKSLVNSILAPFATTDIMVTSFLEEGSDMGWDRYFKLREHKDAQIEHYHVAKLIREAVEETPTQISRTHIPLGGNIINSACNCAYLSYGNFNKAETQSVEQNLDFVNKLLQNEHLGVFEHQLKFTNTSNHSYYKGWSTARQMLAYDNVSTVERMFRDAK